MVENHYFNLDLLDIELQENVNKNSEIIFGFYTHNFDNTSKLVPYANSSSSDSEIENEAKSNNSKDSTDSENFDDSIEDITFNPSNSSDISNDTPDEDVCQAINSSNISNVDVSEENFDLEAGPNSSDIYCTDTPDEDVYQAINPSSNMDVSEENFNLEAGPLDMIDFTRNKKSRSKKSQPKKWRRNVEKTRVQSGVSYVSKSGRLVHAKRVKPIDCTTCRRKCTLKFTEQERITINEQFWKLASTTQQRYYLSNLIKPSLTARKTVSNSRRGRSFSYYLQKSETEQIMVCKNFFLKTYSISDNFVRTIFKKKNEVGVIEGEKRGGKSYLKKTESTVQFIKEHIASFPNVPSHYCRKSSTKNYLPSDLNLNSMYELYQTKCFENGKTPEKKSYYIKIFKTEFNLAFHKPRKDKCDKCYKFEIMTEEEKATNSDMYELHLSNKEAVKKFKEGIKERSLKNEINYSQFDFEAVRYCPKINAKAIFYKRRYSVYNFTVYDVPQKDGTCFMWGESTAGRGSAEVASCLFNHMAVKNNDKEYFFMSDTCSGQNRNINVAIMFLIAAQKFNFPVINQVFFEPGHSFMECDSVHAHIESASRNIEIYDPSGWYTVTRTAGRTNPYNVVEIDQSFIYNFKKIEKDFVKNRKIDSQGENVRWMDIKWMQFRKGEPNKIFFKYKVDESLEFKFFEISRQQRNRLSIANAELVQAYSNELPIAKEKKKDLVDLCDKNMIKSVYQDFYRKLTTTESLLNNSSDVSE